jgi:hypothetical protein
MCRWLQALYAVKLPWLAARQKTDAVEKRQVNLVIVMLRMRRAGFNYRHVQRYTAWHFLALWCCACAKQDLIIAMYSGIRQNGFKYLGHCICRFDGINDLRVESVWGTENWRKMKQKQSWERIKKDELKERSGLFKLNTTRKRSESFWSKCKINKGWFLKFQYAALDVGRHDQL